MLGFQPRVCGIVGLSIKYSPKKFGGQNIAKVCFAPCPSDLYAAMGTKKNHEIKPTAPEEQFVENKCPPPVEA